ncbi:hypothetical protein DFH06DRAFT_1327294 [Mycena polygramma]|nr:hypothetical protein DFH06DRAFT_1327294 [Mycena polygramma]
MPARRDPMAPVFNSRSTRPGLFPSTPCALETGPNFADASVLFAQCIFDGAEVGCPSPSSLFHFAHLYGLDSMIVDFIDETPLLFATNMMHDDAQTPNIRASVYRTLPPKFTTSSTETIKGYRVDVAHQELTTDNDDPPPFTSTASTLSKEDGANYAPSPRVSTRKPLYTSAALSTSPSPAIAGGPQNYGKLPIPAYVEWHYMPWGNRCLVLVSPMTEILSGGDIFLVKGSLQGLWNVREKVYETHRYTMVRIKQTTPGGRSTLILIPRQFDPKTPLDPEHPSVTAVLLAKFGGPLLDSEVNDAWEDNDAWEGKDAWEDVLYRKEDTTWITF